MARTKVEVRKADMPRMVRQVYRALRKAGIRELPRKRAAALYLVECHILFYTPRYLEQVPQEVPPRLMGMLIALWKDFGSEEIMAQMEYERKVRTLHDESGLEFADPVK